MISGGFSIMSNQREKITAFTDLYAWQEGHKLVLATYRQTEDLPKHEVFGLTSQMRRCVVSVTANIAEGFGRRSYREKVRFYTTALGSLIELKNHLLITRDVGFLSREKYDVLITQSVKVHKLINGLIRSSRAIIQNTKN